MESQGLHSSSEERGRLPGEPFQLTASTMIVASARQSSGLTPERNSARIVTCPRRRRGSRGRGRLLQTVKSHASPYRERTSVNPPPVRKMRKTY